MKNIKLIIFDLDGTLVDAYPAIIRSFNYTMENLGYPKQPDLTIRRAVGWGADNLLKPFVKPRDLKKALQMYRRHHKKSLLEGSRLFPKADVVLAKLKNKKYKLAVASNRPTIFTRILIRHLGLSECFDYVLCSDTLKRAKPHPQILNRIMKKFSVKPEQTIYIGDMIIDVKAGRRAGIKTIIVITGSSSRVEIEQERPYRIINRISELLNIITS